jgi:peptidoglycan/xylan/chitin deacetylase (PgdA/CDA1 family)
LLGISHNSTYQDIYISKANYEVMDKLFLLRYDTESGLRKQMDGFFNKIIEIHRQYDIPATFFCQGKKVKSKKRDFMTFYEQIKDDPLFDIQDHSFSHIGVGYANGKPLKVLRKDYEKSFAIHEKVFQKRPTGVSICGVGNSGPRLQGFDETEKAKQELDMLASLGVTMINSFLTTHTESTDFLTYHSLGHPETSGFPSGYSDTRWMHGRNFGDPIEYILTQLEERAEKNQHFPLMLHDWVAWLHADDQELTHVVKFIEKARELGYKAVTHKYCHEHIQELI